MISVFKLPVFKLLVIYVFAIFIGRYTNILPDTVFLAGVLLFIMSLFFYKKALRWAFNITIVLALFFLFLSYFDYRTDYKAQKANLANYSDEIVSFYGTVVSYPKIKIVNKSFVDCKELIREEPITRQEYLVKVYEARFNSGLVHSTKGTMLDNAEGTILVKSRYIIDGLAVGKDIIVHGKARSIQSIKPCIGGFDYRQYLEDKGISYTSYPYSKKNISVLSESSNINVVKLWAMSFRNYLSSFYSTYLASNDNALVQAMVLGKRETLSSTHISIFKKAGIMHILAISGLHVGMISLSFYVVLLSFGIRKKYVFILVGFFLIFYIVVVGYHASILRAVIMYWCFALVFILDRDRHYYNSLLLAGFLSLLLYPTSLFYIGAQLSFLATLGILLYYNKIKEAILSILAYSKLSIKSNSTVTKGIRYFVLYTVSLLSLTLSAQLLILPLIIYYFKGFSLISLVSNLVVVSLAQIVVALAFVLPIFSFSAFLSKVYSAGTAFFIKYIFLSANYFANLPFSYIDISFESGVSYILFILGYYFIVFLLFSGSFFKFFSNNK